MRVRLERTLMNLKRSLPVALVAVAALGLSACSPTPNTALVMNGTSYSLGAVAATAEACNEVLGSEQVTDRGVVSNLIASGIFDDIAKKASQEITQETLDAYLVQSVQGADAMLKDEGCAPFARTYMKAQLLGQISEENVRAAAAGVDVDLNPRFGRWDPAGASLISNSGSMSIATTQTQQ